MSQVRRSKRQRLDDGSTGTEDDVEEIIAEPATVENSVARMFAGRGKAVAGTKRVMTKSTIAEAAVTYRYMTSDGASMPLQNATGYFQTIFLGSQQPFTIEHMTIASGPYAGRTAMVIDPLPCPDKVFPLMSLPPELRIIIYKYVLADTKPIRISMIGRDRVRLDHQGHNKKDHATLNFLRVNWAIRNEALPVFLSINVFDFWNTKAAVAFLAKIGDLVRFIQRITIETSWLWKTGVELMEVLAKATALRSITLKDMVCSQLSANQYKKLIKAVQPWIDAHGNSADTFFKLMRLFCNETDTAPAPFIQADKKLSVECSLYQEGFVDAIVLRYFMNKIITRVEFNEAVFVGLDPVPQVNEVAALNANKTRASRISFASVVGEDDDHDSDSDYVD